jgi:catechol 2,3-dioxygenase-like lactoylglutathione lyase family enzyme
VALLGGIHHIAFLTSDLDRLIAFYEGVFDARLTFDRTEEQMTPRRRHALIDVGGSVLLHPFEVDGAEVPGSAPIFERGRIDHLAFNAPSEEAFREIRRRLIAEGAYAIDGGLVTDMGPMLSLSYRDPDDCWCEVIWVKPDAPTDAAFLAPPEWQMIDLD